MLRSENMNLRRGSRTLLNGVNFSVHPVWGGLTGRNGSGKSTLLALIGGEIAGFG
jgi:ATP-binding cassette subfamily F protein 3